MYTKFDIYENENLVLSEYATKSDQTKGRIKPISPDEIRTDFQRDRDRIIHSKAFRRLKHKTQVFISPGGDHYRTRLTHTLEVAQIGRTIARACRLNEDLVEAIALGHDLGHTPFGHAGEATLDKLVKGGFSHAMHSLRVVDLLENNGQGLNLTYEVRNGIANHKYNDKPCTLEGVVVKYADRFAYINHDIEDAIRANILSEKDLPTECTRILGHSKGERINNLILDIVKTSCDKPFVKQSDEFDKATELLHQFMFDNVYLGSSAKAEEYKTHILIELLFNHYLNHLEQLPEFYQTLLKDWDITTVCGDYVASFTDRYAVKIFEDIFVPKEWNS